MHMHTSHPHYPRFHLAFPVADLAGARRFYGEVLGCGEGRTSDGRVDFDFFGHPIVAHKVARHDMADATSRVDGHDVPVRHFGVVTELPIRERLADKLRAAKVKFVIEPYVRFKCQAGEQATMFLLDPFGNALGLNAFADMGRLFAK
jgi:extradiol dioxygenase family protein